MLEEAFDPGELGEDQHTNPYAWVMPTASACGGLVVVVLAIVAIYLIAHGAETSNLLALGYPGISVVMFFSSATVLLPAPGFATVMAASGLMQMNPWLLGAFGAFGSSLGELTGYMVGLGSRQALHIERRSWIRRCEFFMRRWGFLTILAMASFPNPAFDAVGILAGSLGYSARRMWLATLIGNTIKYTSLALLGGTAAAFFLHD